MSDMISLPAHEIPDSARHSLETLLGQPLAGDQQVCVMVFSPGKLADERARRMAVENIRHTLDKIDRHRAAHGVRDEEVDAAVDEATDYVRPHSG